MARLPELNDNVRHWLLAAAVLAGLAGAVVGQQYLDRVWEPLPAPPTLKANQPPPGVLWHAARASAVGNAYNRARDAARNADRAALADAMDDLRQLKAASRAEPLALAAAEELVSQAGMLDMQAQNLKGAQAKSMQAQAALQYREAQRLSPRFASSDPNLVNSLGYFLAERGSTPADFREAERLTRRSLQIYDEQIKRLEDEEDAEFASKVFSRANTRDSLAWALYRQRRYEEALREQQQAIFEATLATKANAEPVPAELHFHLGEIYRALKRWDQAREQYDTALELKPEYSEAQQALKQLPTQGSKTPSAMPQKKAPKERKTLPLPQVPAPDNSPPHNSPPDDVEPDARGIPRTGPLIARAQLAARAQTTAL